MNITLEKIRRIHQELMDSLQGIIDFGHPQLLLEFTALFLKCLIKMFFAQEASTRPNMLRQAIGMASTSVWIIMVVFCFCYVIRFDDAAPLDAAAPCCGMLGGAAVASTAAAVVVAATGTTARAKNITYEYLY